MHKDKISDRDSTPLHLTAEKGKPIERLSRKATDLRATAYDSGAARHQVCFVDD